MSDNFTKHIFVPTSKQFIQDLYLKTEKVFSRGNNSAGLSFLEGCEVEAVVADIFITLLSYFERDIYRQILLSVGEQCTIQTPYVQVGFLWHK